MNWVLLKAGVTIKIAMRLAKQTIAKPVIVTLPKPALAANNRVAADRGEYRQAAGVGA